MYTHSLTHVLSYTYCLLRGAEHAHPAARGRALREKAVLPLRLHVRTSRDPEGKGAKGLGETNFVRQRPWTVFVVVPRLSFHIRPKAKSDERVSTYHTQQDTSLIALP